ncbi:MAG: hypothetical protein AB7F86_06945 [Bdellovibrionales bacterium]
MSTLSLAVLILASAWGQGPAQDRTANPAGSEDLYYETPPKEQAQKPWQECLIQLCKVQTEERSMTFLGGSYGDFSKANRRSMKLTQVVRESITHQLQTERSEIEDLLKAAEKDRKIDNPQVLKIEYASRLMSAQNYIRYKTDLTWDKERTREALKGQGYDGAELQDSLSLMEANEKERPTYPSLFMKGPIGLSPQEIKAQIQRSVREIDENRKALSKELGINFEQADPSEALQWTRLKDGLQAEDFSPHNLEELGRMWAGSKAFQVALSVVEKSPVQGPMALKEQMTPALIARAKARLAEIEKLLETKPIIGQSPYAMPSDVDVITKAQGLCQQALAVIDNQFPDSPAVKKLKANEKSWRQEFLKTTSRWLSHETQGEFTSFFNHLSVRTSITRDEWLKDRLGRIQGMATQPAPMTGAAALTAQQLGYLSTLNVLKFGGDDSVKEVEQTCLEGGAMPNVQSHAFMGTNKVFLGADVARNLDIARDGAMHEYGHILQGWLEPPGQMPAIGKVSEASRKWFRARFDCVHKHHSGGDSKWDAENFADLVRYGVTDKVDFACRFPNLYDEKTFTLVSNDPQHHSSDLTRILRSTPAEKIPPVCYEALKAKGEQFEPHDCMKDSSHH